MHVFISWSGKRSRTVATALRTWLRAPLSPEVETWLSSVDITTGEQWDTELRKALAESSFGIICLTEEALRSPWVVFEAGALGKISSVACVAPYLIGLSLHDVPEPFRRYQATQATREGTWTLVESINKRLTATRRRSADLRRRFARAWPRLQRILDDLPPPKPRSDLPADLLQPLLARRDAIGGTQGTLLRIILRRARQPRTAIDGTFVLSEFRRKADRDVTESELYYRLEQLRLLGLISKKPVPHSKINRYHLSPAYVQALAGRSLEGFDE